MIRKGEKWNLSRDGHFLYLSNPFNEENFFKIKQKTKGKIIFERYEKLSLNEKRPSGYARIKLGMTFQKQIDKD